jgi:pteridine reductase
MPSNRPAALITGGAKRVGRAIAERLSEAGYFIHFTYLSSDSEAQELASQLKNAKAIRADLTKPADGIAAIQNARIDRLDVLVNNASLYAPAELTDTTLDLSRKLMAIHYESPLLLCQAFAPLLRQSRGHVVNMLDLQVERPNAKYLPYCASKAALWNLTMGLARALAPEVTVNGIAPGVVEWPADYPEDEKEKYLKRVPLARPGSAQDVAELVHFLCTAGSYISGQIIHLDGGRSIT